MKRAFTLVELAIVLMIVGLLIGGSFKLLKMQRYKEKTQEAKETVQTAKDAVIGNTLINDNTLPDKDFFKNNLSPIANNVHPLLYTYDTQLASNNICAFNSTKLSVKTPTKTISNVAFVIVSEGANGNMQTAVTDDGSGNYSVTIYDYSQKKDDNTTPVNVVDNYDDIATWVTLAQLQKEAECSSKPLRFLNDSLPTATKGETYSATLYVENNITDVSVNCQPVSDKGISFNNTNFTFSGTPTTEGTSYRTCTATENAPSNRSISKSYVITINSDASGSGGNGNGGSNGNEFGIGFP